MLFMTDGKIHLVYINVYLCTINLEKMHHMNQHNFLPLSHVCLTKQSLHCRDLMQNTLYFRLYYQPKGPNYILFATLDRRKEITNVNTAAHSLTSLVM